MLRNEQTPGAYDEQQDAEQAKGYGEVAHTPERAIQGDVKKYVKGRMFFHNTREWVFYTGTSRNDGVSINPTRLVAVSVAIDSVYQRAWKNF